MKDATPIRRDSRDFLDARRIPSRFKLTFVSSFAIRISDAGIHANYASGIIFNFWNSMNRRYLLIRTNSAITLLLTIYAQAIAQHPLDSWVRRTVPTPNSALNSVAYGNGTFVAVGNNSFIARSTDGITWSTSTAGAYGTLKRVRFMDNQFVALGSSDKLIFSSDGANWTASTLPRAGFWDIALGNGVYVLAGSATYVSSDGVNWTQTHPMITESGTRETLLDTVLFGNGRFLALSTRGGGSLGLARQSLFSTNGTNWTAQAGGQTSPSGGQGELLYEGSVWLSVMDDPMQARDFGGILASTNNGVTWVRRFENLPIPPEAGSALAYGQGFFVAVLPYDGVHVVTSTNGFLTWQDRFPFAPEYRFAAARGCVFGNGTFVGVGYGEQSESFIIQSGNIGGAPIIFQEPQDRSAVVDNPVTFTVQAVGAPPLWYQWYHDSNPISGATNTSYSIAHVATSDVGGYHVIISNSINSVTSRVAKLTVAFLGIDRYAGIKILGVPGRTYHIEATPDIGPANWQTLTNLVLPSTPYIWFDVESPSVPARIYRASELP